MRHLCCSSGYLSVFADGFTQYDGTELWVVPKASFPKDLRVGGGPGGHQSADLLETSLSSSDPFARITKQCAVTSRSADCGGRG